MIPNPPSGFGYDPNAYAARVVFPDRTKVSQRAYATLTEPYNSIYITEFEGTSTKEDAERARAALAERYDYSDYGPLETLTIDGRESWGWLESSYYEGKLSSLEFKAVVPYENVTYTVEFDTNEPDEMNADYLREVVSTFIIKKNSALSAGTIVLVLVMAAIGWWGWKFLERAKYDRGPS